MSNLFRLPIAILLLITASSVQAEINWHIELREAHSVAKNQNRPILLHFYADDCVWCEKLERGAFASPEVAEAIHANFVPVKIHANSSPTLAKMFKVDKFPSDVIVTTTGDTMSHSVSPQDVSRYLEMLQNALLVERPASTPTIDASPEPNETGPVNPLVLAWTIHARSLSKQEMQFTFRPIEQSPLAPAGETSKRSTDYLLLGGGTQTTSPPQNILSQNEN